MLEEALRVAENPQSAQIERGRTTSADPAKAPKQTSFGRVSCCSVKSKSYIRLYKEEKGKYESIFNASGKNHREQFERAWQIASRENITLDEFLLAGGLIKLGRPLPWEVDVRPTPATTSPTPAAANKPAEAPAASTVAAEPVKVLTADANYCEDDLTDESKDLFATEDEKGPDSPDPVPEHVGKKEEADTGEDIS